MAFQLLVCVAALCWLGRLLLFGRGLRVVDLLADRWRCRRPQPAHPPLERIAADLHRISTDLRRLEHAERLPAHLLRLRSVAAAYDETLLLACRVLEVPVDPAGTVPLPAEERLRAEADLARAGLKW